MVCLICGEYDKFEWKRNPKVLSRLKKCNAANCIEIRVDIGVDIGEVKQMMWTDDSFAQREGGSANGLKLLATESPTWEYKYKYKYKQK